ncbi:MAG: ABC transporter ATP-binding protein [bacterium]
MSANAERLTGAIEVRDVVQGFGKVEVLHGVSLTVESGRIVGLLGPSGAGKTTLVKLVAGVDRQRSGTVHVGGKPMPSLELMAGIGYVAQSDALYRELSGRENMEFFGALYGLHGARLHERVDACIALVDLTQHLDRPVQDYSGGMRRRLSLAIALLHEPGVLILDEPTVGIDPVLRKSVWRRLHAYAEQGASLLITTHVMDEADRCDRVAMMRDGRLIAEDTPAALKKAAGVETLEETFLHFCGEAQP